MSHRPLLHACVLLLLLATPAPAEAPAARSQRAAPGLVQKNGPLTSESEYTIEDAILRRFHMKLMVKTGFDDFEAAAKAFRDSKERYPSGEYKLVKFYRAIWTPMDLPSVGPAMDAWIAAAPASPTPYIVKAQLKLESLARGVQRAFFSRAPTQTAALDAEKLGIIYLT